MTQIKIIVEKHPEGYFWKDAFEMGEVIETFVAEVAV